MRLSLSAKSKNEITYLPDTLIIKNGKKTYEYDIQGSDEYDTEQLDCYIKGELYVMDETTDDYEPIAAEEYDTVKDLLTNPKSKVTVMVYPDGDDLEDGEITDRIRTDKIGKGFGNFDYFSVKKNKWVNVNFTFKAVLQD